MAGSCWLRGAKLEFPMDYSIKVMGFNQPEFMDVLLAHMKPTIPDCMDTPVKTALSKADKYISITIAFQAQSSAHVDEVFAQARTCPGVLMAL